MIKDYIILNHFLDFSSFESIKLIAKKIFEENYTRYIDIYQSYITDILKQELSRNKLTDFIISSQNFKFWFSLVIRVRKNINPIRKPEKIMTLLNNYASIQGPVEALKKAFQKEDSETQLYIKIIKDPKITSNDLDCLYECDRCCEEKLNECSDYFRDTDNVEICKKNCYKERCLSLT